MKRVYWFMSLLVTYITSVSANSLSASIAGGSYGAAEIIAALFGPFFGALLNAPPHLVFENSLLFFIIFCVTFMVVKQMDVLNKNNAVVMIVSLSVSILAARFMSIEAIYAVLLPYQALGISLSAFVPLLIGFFFINQFKSSILRKIFWIFFTVVFLAMWDARYYAAGAYAWIYFWTAIVSLLFFVFDGTIRRAILKSQLQEQNESTNLEFARKIRRELQELHRDHTSGVVDAEEYNRIKRRLTKQLHNLSKF